MWPVIMLAAQLLAKQQQEAQAKQDELIKLKEQNAARLGGPTAPMEAANWKYDQTQKNYADPAQLAKIYGTSAPSPAPALNKPIGAVAMPAADSAGSSPYDYGSSLDLGQDEDLQLA